MVDRASFPVQKTNAVCRVADGPIDGTGWYVLDNASRAITAPGGVVLCHDRTAAPHPDAGRHAKTAWTLLGCWRADNPGSARSGEHSPSNEAA